MSREYMELGSVPAEEDCAQVGSADYQSREKRESAAYINQLKRAFPDWEKAGVWFKRTSNPHDFGTYHEVAVGYETDEPASVEMAFRIEREVPGTWDAEARQELGLDAPSGGVDGGAPKKKDHQISVEQTLANTGRTLDEWVNSIEAHDSVVPACCDAGCEVEPDGRCEHGCPSVLLALGVI